MEKAVKKVSVFLLLAAVFTFVGCAEAKKQTFGPVEVDVPKGWEVSETDEQLTFTAPDNSAALTIMVEIIEDTTVKAVADGIAKEFKGGKPKAVEGGFGFTFKNANGIDCDTFVGGNEETGFYMVIMKVGDHPDMDDLVDSLEFNDE